METLDKIFNNNKLIKKFISIPLNNSSLIEHAISHNRLDVIKKILKFKPDLINSYEQEFTNILKTDNFEIFEIVDIINIVDFSILNVLPEELEKNLLKNKNKINWERQISYAPLISWIVLLSDNDEFIKLYKKHGNSGIATLLINKKNDLTKIEKLLKCNRNESLKSYPLSIVTLNNARINKSMDKIVLVLFDLYKKYNYDFNSTYKFKNVLIYYIRYYQEYDDILIEFLLKNCDINLTDNELNTVGHYVFYTNKLKLDYQKIILDKLDNINQQNYKGYSVLYYLIKKSNWKLYKNILINKELELFTKSKPVYELKNKEFNKFVCSKYKIKDILELKNNDIVDINIGEYVYANSFSYTATNMTLLLYSLNLLEKYDQLGIPFYPDRMTLKIRNNYPDMKFNNYVQNNLLLFKILPHLIICWHDENNYYIPEKINEAVKYSINNNKKYILIHLTLVKSILHANVLLLDVKAKKIYHFDPYGYFIDDIKIYDLLGEKLEQIITGFKYISPMKFEPEKGFQTISNENYSENVKVVDIGGYCLSWCFWWVELVLENTKYDQKTLITKSIKKLINYKYSITEHIRNYANHRTTIMHETILACGLNYKDINNRNIIFNKNLINCIKQKLYSIVQ